jgi:hypothetical protein
MIPELGPVVVVHAAGGGGAGSAAEAEAEAARERRRKKASALPSVHTFAPAALKKVKMKAQRQAAFSVVWTSAQSSARAKMGVWAPDLHEDYDGGGGGGGALLRAAKGRANRQRVCLGHFLRAGTFDAPDEKGKDCQCLVLELTDNNTMGVKGSEKIDSVLQQLFPHPARYQQVWSQAQSQAGFGKALYTWRAIPPSEDFVALGMLATASEEPPQPEAMRCVPRRWCAPSKTKPVELWNDAGTAGRQGSIWRVSSLNLFAVSQGHGPPTGTFYELTSQRFFLSPEDGLVAQAMHAKIQEAAGGGRAPGAPAESIDLDGVGTIRTASTAGDSGPPVPPPKVKSKRMSMFGKK